jgi:hypothetical protein
LTRLVVGTAIAAGLIARIVMIRAPIGVLDSDEAVVGLMARHFGQGHFRAFFWGQNYGGTIETVLTAALFRIVGTSTLALKIVPLALNGLAAVLVWRIGRRLMAAWAAVAAGLLLWLWPANYIWWSIKARGFYEATLCITLACVLLMLRIAADKRGGRVGAWVVVGLLAGLGWWQTPQVVYILAPAGLWLAITRPATLRRAWAAIPGALVGALPWLVANITSGFASLHPPPATIKGTYAAHLLTFARIGLPMTFGLKYIYLAVWIGSFGSRHLAALIYALGVAAVVIGCLRRQPHSLLLGLVIISYPFIHAVLTLSSEVAEGRYTLFLLPWLALAIARATPRPAVMAAVFAIALSVTWVGLQDMRGQTAPYAFDRHVPTSLASLEHALDAQHITRVWANYWIAYRLTFETHERVIAATTTLVRDPQYNREVEQAAHPAFVFITGSADIEQFHAYLQRQQINYIEDIVDGTWVIDIPASHVAPSHVPNITV